MGNLTLEITNNDLGISTIGANDITVSSPFRDDSNPSFRCYVTSDGGFYDWGTGKSYTPVSLIMELYDIPYRDAVSYINVNYGININNKMVDEDNKLSDKIKIILNLRKSASKK